MSERTPKTEEVDVLVIGGGPSGSTVASLVRKYHPSLSVQVAEQSRFPRHHIGESLILEINRILADMDALEPVSRAGFLPKSGASFVWGRDREPWRLLFDDGKVSRGRPDPNGIFRYTWHVERARYDQILLDVARGHGADVRESRALEPIYDGARVVGAKLRDSDGSERSVRARFVVDAGGRNSILAHRVGTRVFDPLLRNVATYAYFRNAKILPRYSYREDRPTTFVISIPIGWIWYIPLGDGVVSVGVVTSHASFQQMKGNDLEAFLRSQIATSPEVMECIEGAEIMDFPLADRRVLVENDFNYLNDKLAAPGAALCGDAGGFVDPLFSIGVFLAQTAGQLLAYSVGTLLDGGGVLDEARLLASYEQHVKSNIDAFRSMAYVFYGFNESKEEWWRRTRDMMRTQALPDDIDDRDAFIALTFGFGVNVSLFNEAMGFLGGPIGTQIRQALQLGSAYGQPGDHAPVDIPHVDGRARLRLSRPYRMTPSAVPVEGMGRMVPMMRVELGPVPGSPPEQAFPRHLFLPDSLVFLMERFDGKATADDLFTEARRRGAFEGAEANEERRTFQRVLGSLTGLGAVAPVA